MRFFRVHLMGHIVEILGFTPEQEPGIQVATRSPALIGTRPGLPESALFQGRDEWPAIYGWSAIFGIDPEPLDWPKAVAESLGKRIRKPFTGSPEQLLELGWDEAMREAGRGVWGRRKP